MQGRQAKDMGSYRDGLQLLLVLVSLKPKTANCMSFFVQMERSGVLSMWCALVFIELVNIQHKKIRV